MIYGYSRVSTNKQSHARQISAIRERYPECVKIYKDNCTGKTQSRDEWRKLLEKVKAGDTIVFEDVSRMSRNATEGFAEYKELYARGIELVFLSSPHINTEKYRELLRQNEHNPMKEAFEQIQTIQTGNPSFDKLLSGMMWNFQEFFEDLSMQNVEKDIIQAFQKAEDEISKLSERTRQGMQAHGATAKIKKAKTGTQYRNANILNRMIVVLMNSKAFNVCEHNTHTDVETARLAETSVRSVVRIRQRIIEEKGKKTDTEFLQQLQKELKDVQSGKRTRKKKTSSTPKPKKKNKGKETVPEESLPNQLTFDDSPLIDNNKSESDIESDA